MNTTDQQKTKRITRSSKGQVPSYRTAERHEVLVEHGYIPGVSSEDGSCVYYYLEGDDSGNYGAVLDQGSGTVAVYSSQYAGPCYLFDSAVALDEFLELRKIFG